MTTTLLQPQRVQPANDGHVRDSMTADERLMRKALDRCLKAQLSEVHSRVESGKKAASVPGSVKSWDDMVMREVRPVWFGLFKKGGDRALKNIRKFPRHAKKMAVLSWAEFQASERVDVVCKGGQGSGNFGHEGRPGEVGGSGEGGGSVDDALSKLDSLPTSTSAVELWSDAKEVPFEVHDMRLDSQITDELLSQSPIRDIPVEGLIASQSFIRASKVRSMLEHPEKLPTDDRELPIVARLGGKDYIHDGMHRITAAKLRGDKTVRVQYVNIDQAKTKSLKAPRSARITIPDWIEDPRVLDALEKEMFKFAHEINQTTADMLRQTLITGMEEGYDIRSLANSISDLSDEWVEGWRSEMIARTETARAYSTGNIEAWKSTGVVDRKVWRTAGDACPFCKQMDGMVVGLEENFFDQGEEQDTEWRGETLVMDHDYSDIGGPPLHPNCRCVLVGELKE